MVITENMGHWEPLNGSVIKRGDGSIDDTIFAAVCGTGARTITFTPVAEETAWTEDAVNGGYYQTVSVPGIISKDDPIADVVMGTDIEANQLYTEAWARVTRITTGDNQVTLWANTAAPTVSFSFQLKVVR